MSTEITISNNDQFKVLQTQCVAAIDSGFLPEHITHKKGDTPFSSRVQQARAITIAIKGRELGLPLMQSFSSITVIKGKPCFSAEVMMALIFQRVPKVQIDFVTPPDKANIECEIKVVRPPSKTVNTFKFTIEDAKRAKIDVRWDKKKNAFVPQESWSKYPAAMLRARAISALARAKFPDAIMGCYTPEEMGSVVAPEPSAESAKKIEVKDATPADSLHQKVTQPNPADGKVNQQDFDDFMEAARSIGATPADIMASMKSLFNKERYSELTPEESGDLFKELETVFNNRTAEDQNKGVQE